MSQGIDCLVLGASGLVGSAVYSKLIGAGYETFGATRSDADLLVYEQVEHLIGKCRPKTIILAAAKVGGVVANSEAPVEFLTENLVTQNNVLTLAHKFKVARLVFLGSSCIYPKLAPQPIKEEYLLTGPLEPTNEAYALAKIVGLKLIQGYRSEYGNRWISLMPTNLYGPNDNFDLQKSHVIPGLLRRFHEAKVSSSTSIKLWGTGSTKREFMYSEDFAGALIHLMENYDSSEPINVGTGVDISIRELADKVAKLVGYEGKIEWDHSRPDGTPRKLLDVKKLKSLGWESQVDLDEGLYLTYKWFLESSSKKRL